MNNKERIELMTSRLTDALTPVKLEIIDQSQAHVGHAGAASGAGHFAIVIVSDDFLGKTPVQRHQMVFQAVGDMMQSEIHALSIQAKTQEEF